MTQYERGSEWRKWDLHLHTASSYDYKYKGDDADEKLVDALREKEIAAVAITDHFCIDSKRIAHLRELAPEITFFPGVELRTDKGASNVHVILIFSETEDLEQLETEFFVKMRGPRSVAKNPDNDERIYWDYHDICNFAKEHGGLISIHAGSKTNGIDQEISSALPVKDAIKEEYASTVDIFEIGQPEKDVSDYEGIVFKEIKRKPLVYCSDCHNPNEYHKDSDAKGFLWIKADPTFNGLKQILYEPETRVRIDKTQPETKPNYQTIREIVFDDPLFQVDAIPLNDKLNCIIGGKSTGKSILLRNIAYAVDRDQVIEKEKGSSYSPHSVNMKVHWCDEETAERKLVYIPQSYLNKLTDNPEETTEVDEIIKDIVMSNESISKAYEEFSLKRDSLKEELDKSIYQYISLREKVQKIEVAIKELGNEEGIKKEIARLDAERQALAKSEALSEAEYTRFDALSKSIANINNELQMLNNDKKVISSAGSVVSPASFSALLADQDLKAKVTKTVESIVQNANKAWSDEKRSILQEIGNRESCLVEKLNKESSSYKEIESKIKNDKAIGTLVSSINKEGQKLQTIESHKKQLALLKKELLVVTHFLQNVHKDFFDIYNRFAEYANESLKSKSRELDIVIEIPFRCDSFKEMMGDTFDRRSLKTIMDLDEFSSSDYNEAFVERLISAFSSDSLKTKVSYTGETAMREALGDWYNLTYKVALSGDNDTINQMSPGKRAALLLKVLIKLADKESPILIDQPEDDLDNRSIWEELIEFIKERKIDRQFIIVTHNANVVLGCDAEEIIVANQCGINSPNNKYRFEYRTGSIEDDRPVMDSKGKKIPGILNNQGIQQHICSILEGGSDAFELRRNKYRMN